MHVLDWTCVMKTQDPTVAWVMTSSLHWSGSSQGTGYFSPGILVVKTGLLETLKVTLVKTKTFFVRKVLEDFTYSAL